MEFIDLKKQYKQLEKNINSAITNVLKHGRYIKGPEVKLLENELSSYCNVNSCITVANGTEALYLSLKSLEIGRGDEVITTPHTAVATISAISLTGATPVFVDIEEDYFTIDPKKIIASINKNTKAILPVHIYGQSADMDEIMKIVKIGIVCLLLSGCSVKFDNYDPTTAMFRWIISHDK